MKKKIIMLLSALILLFCFSSCKPTDGPQGVAEQFIKGMKVYDISAMTECVTEFPTVSKDLLTYDIFSDANYVSLFQKAYEKAKISVSVDKKSEAAAVATCKVTSPNLSDAYASAMYTVASQIFSDENLYALVQDEDADLTGLIPQQMIKMLENGSIETSEREYTLSLRSVDGKWKIVDDDNFRLFLTSDLYQNVKNTIEGMTSEDE